MKKFSVCIVMTVLCFQLNFIQETFSENTSQKSALPKSYTEKKFFTENRFNTAAKKIAGNLIDEKLKSDPRLEDYARSIERSWSFIYNDSISKVSNWANKYLTPTTKEFDTVFYPFGGPDISYAFGFFPESRRYILVGLEPLGNFLKIEASLSDAATYEAIKIAFSHYLRKGYFITSEMITQLSNDNIRGGLNVMLLQIAKLGYDVISIENCAIDANGEIVSSNLGNIDCVKIICGKNSVQKEIYYVRTNLNNQNSKLSYLKNFVKKFECSTFIKSASYALHDGNFSNIRDFILKESNCILQDDTGVPFNFFRLDWEINIFGKYTKPTLPVFKSYKQYGLENYYAEHKAVPITFPIGYGYTQKNPNLVFVISKRKKIINQIAKLREELKQKSCNCSKKNSKDNQEAS